MELSIRSPTRALGIWSLSQELQVASYRGVTSGLGPEGSRLWREALGVDCGGELQVLGSMPHLLETLTRCLQETMMWSEKSNFPLASLAFCLGRTECACVCTWVFIWCVYECMCWSICACVYLVGGVLSLGSNKTDHLWVSATIRCVMLGVLK